MTMKGFTLKFKPLEILTEEQIGTIHQRTLEVLEETGVRVEHERALKLFKENGCEVDFDKRRVRIPNSLVEECLSKCPSSFQVKARNSRNDLALGEKTMYFGTYPGMKIVNLETWESRTPTRREYYDGVTILDALDNLHLTNCYTPYFGFKGIAESMSIPESIAARIRNSTKVHTTCYRQDSEIFSIKMAKEVGAENIGVLTTSPPLTYDKDSLLSCFRFCEAGFPYAVVGGATMGGTAPTTIAGSMVTTNAELMGGIVLAQLIRPGTRILASDTVFPQDMRSGSPAFGTIGVGLHYAVFNQIWHKYEIPTACSAPGATNSKRVDFQCGYERSINALIAALSGADVVFLYGGVHGELTFHPVQAVLDDDIAGMIGRFVEGVEVNDETLAIDLIKEVGPIPGFYLGKEHTRKWWRKEQFVPKAADRLTYPEWLEEGKKSAIDYGKERVNEILDTHRPEPLTDDQEDAIENILEEARNYYKEKGLM